MGEPERVGEDPGRAASILHRRRLARQSIAAYSQVIDVPGKPVSKDEEEWQFHPIETSVAAHHVLVMNVIQQAIETENGRFILMLPPGAAKALALGTPIPTPTGWTTMGALRVGDQVFDERGQPCNVTWVSPVWRERPVYRVRTDCGDEIIADRDHEWRVRLCRKPRQALKWKGRGHPPLPNRDDPASHFKIKETWELCRKRTKRPLIERANALVLPETELPIAPYLLGLWLGDGHSSSTRITASPDDMEWMRGELARLGYKTSDSKDGRSFGLLGIRAAFVGLGLLHDPWHETFGRKYIPAAYLRASIDQRRSLLQGLIDSDGTICRKRGCATFCNTNRMLAEQIRDLVRSLGVKAGWSERRAVVDGKDCGAAYNVSFYMRDAARLPRKARLCRDQYRTPNTYIDVEPAGTADTVCIEVDSPSHLFLCGRSMTPTHNSTYASVVSPTWMMGRYPGSRAIIASHTSKLARKFGRRARQIIASRSYPGVFGARLHPASKAADEWALTNGSEFMTGGILSGVGGNRAEFLHVDDPLRGRDDADSKTIKERIREEYEDVLVPRLTPGGALGVTMTRWSPDDLVGTILPEDWDGESGMIACRDGLEWNVVRVPAIADRPDDPLGRTIGEGLWPEWFKPGHWEPFRKIRRTWNALYQQIPRAPEGGFFKREWFKVEDQAPSQFVRLCRRWDLAASEGEGDWSVGVLGGIDREGTFWVLHVERFQFGPGRAEKRMEEIAAGDHQRWGGLVKVVFPREPGAAGKIAVRHFALRFRRYPHGFAQETKAKHIRARPLASAFESDLVRLCRGPWNDTFVEELCAFDEGIAEAHGDQIDDQVDAAAGCYHELVGRRGGRAGAGPSAG